MTQLFNISINGVDITHRHNMCTISEEINRFYDVATIQIDNSSDVVLESDVVINYGGKTFTGFVYSSSRVGKNSVRVECRTMSAKLTDPYSTSESVFDSALNSLDLCAYYATKTGIPITNTSSSLDFGGSYERNGTILSALSTIAAVTASEFYDENGTVYIVPNKEITTTGTIIPDSDIFDFVPSDKSIYNQGVGYITIQNGGNTTTDIVSKNNIYMEIDECSGDIYVFPNPNGVIEHSNGISPLVAISVERKEERSVLDEDIINLDGAIESISSVTLNGENITNYKFEVGHNVIYFSTTQRGTISVTYTASAYKGYSNISVTPLGRFISLDLFYLDQALSFQGFLSPDCINSSTDGDMTCIIPKTMSYPKGFDVWTIGGVPEFIFYDKNIVIDRPTTSTVGNYISVEEATIEKTLTGYRYQTRYPLDTALGVRSSGVDIAYTTSSDVDGYYFELTQYFPNVVVSYQTAGVKHTVQFTDIPGGSVAMVIRNANTGKTNEYDLLGIDMSDLSTVPCVLNQSVPVNIAGQLGMEVADVYGIELTYSRPGTSTATGIVDEFGILMVYVATDGDYVVNTSSLKARTSITLTANVNG